MAYRSHVTTCGDSRMRPPTRLRTSLIGVIEPRNTASSLPWKPAFRNSCPFLHVLLAAAIFLLSIAPASARAQQSSSAEGSASVAGTVLDASGATISGADVSLRHGNGSQFHSMASEANGEFSFTKLPAGSYLVIVNAKGFARFASAEFAVAVRQAYEVPDVSLSVASASIEVTVRPTEFIAAEQIRAEEKQRLVGFFPNFYTSYIYDAAPLTAKQKFSLATRGTFDPVAMLGIGFAAGIEQATNAYSGYGQGFAGYSKRFAAKFADGRSSDLLTHAVFPALLHQDPRYYYQGSGSVKSRLMHAVSSAFLTRNDSGRTVFNSSYFLGDLSAAALSNLYYPKENRGANLVFTNAAVGLAGRIGTNLMREFLSKRLSTNVPGNGKL
ncbi:MAG TPA: carboxypeptidase-like regulatory domain-containing protein [Candidatus Acidoferrum sp.]|nr:carboxypeptidase-like regulatory domain-containing protein [Candidatus Acidoferrum sp.]